MLGDAHVETQAVAEGKAATALLEVRLSAILYAAEGINLYELHPLAGEPLPPFTAGAHVDLHLPGGLVRQYSIANPEAERHRYVLGVKRDAASRGGSRFMHDNLRVGTILKIGLPRNNFRLVESAPHSVLIAGGIGITPMVSMVARLNALGRSWELHYAVRRRDEAAFFKSLNESGGRRVHLHVDEEHGAVLDVARLVTAATPESHLYCCGPAPMLQAFERAAAGRSVDHVHTEHFSAPKEAATGGGFVVTLARSGIEVIVRPGQTILEALRSAGIKVQASCEQGICGSCETRVLAGEPEHRDTILSPDEQATNEVMMICCSGCKSERLTLDL